jgi:deazaflavin-dependent oxidoreductase (nitroreductase family)
MEKESAMPGSVGNAFMMALLRSPMHSLLGDGLAVITVTGRKTGRKISTPINVSREGDGFSVVSFRSRTWWKNLLAGRPGELRIGGKTIAVTAKIDDRPEDVAEGLGVYLEHHPGYAKYFRIQSGQDGRFPAEDIARAAKDRVMIHLAPEKIG